jgi:hypothetical protein
MISREDFLKIIKDFPEDNERFNQIKDDIMLYHAESVGKVLNQSCFSCKSKSHLVMECPIIHFIADKEKVIK